MKSWKTTFCGILALVGGGMTQFFQDYPLAFKIGGFLATVAPAVGLLFARDNKVTSEAAGAIAKPTSIPGAGGTGRILGALFCAVALVMLAPACRTPIFGPKAETRAYFALADTKSFVDGAEKIYGREVALGRVSQEQQNVIDSKITEFHAAYLLALQLAQTNGEEITPLGVQALADSLVGIILDLRNK